MEKLEDYEKMLDVDKKNEGDFVTIWDFTSASYVNQISDNEYEQVEPLCYLSDEVGTLSSYFELFKEAFSSFVGRSPPFIFREFGFRT
jgi:hypothetical protein